MSSIDQLYPFSTEDAKAIPLDIIRPLALIRKSFPAAGVSSITIPADWAVASFFSSVGCFIQFAAATIPNPPADGTSYANTLFVPPNCVVSSTALVGVATLVSFNGTAGTLIAQQVQKWAGLALARQLKTR